MAPGPANEGGVGDKAPRQWQLVVVLNVARHRAEGASSEELPPPSMLPLEQRGALARCLSNASLLLAGNLRAEVEKVSAFSGPASISLAELVALLPGAGFIPGGGAVVQA
jgi:hypothetical protein